MNAPYKIDTSKGQMVGTVSAQWANRSEDQRFLSLTDLLAQVQEWRDQSYVREILPKQITARAIDGALQVDVQDLTVDASHWSFGQIASLAGAPAYYLRRLPPALAAVNVNYGLRAAEQKKHAAYILGPDGQPHNLRGITSPQYGRIFDTDVVQAVMKLAGTGTGDTNWKVPGTIEWGGAHGITYNPNVVITKQNTTLYASDRDLFLFLVDDTHPIEVGKLADGSPDLMFRGFYVWNSEVGSRTFGVATMYLRGVCQNRNLWGVEGFSEVTFKHSSGAPEKFLLEAAPALESFAQGSTSKLVLGVQKAKAAIVSRTDNERIEFIQKFGFSEKQARALIETSIAEEGKPQESVWDHAQALTAQARTVEFQDKRIHLEMTAGKMLDKVTV